MTGVGADQPSETRSNALGARWLKKLLAPNGYTLELVRLKPDILHFDWAMGLIREGR
jgi:N-dimethylarginine dimethylaminohydrolase